MTISYSVKDICKQIDNEYHLIGNQSDIQINKITTPLSADEHSLVFITPINPDKQNMLKKTRARLVICDDTLIDKDLSDKCFIVVDNPKYIFAKIGNALFLKKHQYSIHPSAVIHPEAQIARNVFIGPNTYIGKCMIGEESVIYGNCFFYDNVIIGKKVVVQAGCVLGASGCGQVQGENGTYEPFPHIGRLIIEENVEIGTNSCIARGALDDTIIKQGTVIDSFVQVGHNVLIEENVLILANSVIGGSSIIKKNAFLAIGTHVCDYITIGSYAHIGPSVTVMQSVTDGSKLLPRPPLTLPATQQRI